MTEQPPDMLYPTPPPTVAGEFGEDALVKAPAVEVMQWQGWECQDLYHEWAAGTSSEGRQNEHEVILVKRLRLALARLNPNIPENGIDQAIEELTRDRTKMIPVAANQESYKLLKDGVKITVADDQGANLVMTVDLIDWKQPDNNDFFLAAEYWVAGDVYRRRCDLVGFVNGIPLLLFELKATHKNLENAFKDNLRDYRDAIPQLFTPNAFVVLSNGSESKIGGSFAPWEHFFEWKRINDEGETGVVSLETVLRGTCTKERLLDIVENFSVFEEAPGGLIKKVAKNHQYLGVNRSIEEVRNLGSNQGRLGVFWHTQGSGKSLSMVFLTQKIMRKIPGNWTFLIVTDRNELDDQIYKTFAATGAVTETEAQATSGENLKQLLTEDHRYVFSLIQKFRTSDGGVYPKLSDRSDIIVITDEAHRTQYDGLALNMRNALPNAAFLGFTGTPLIAGEEKTKEVFGNYVSVYNFAQSIADGATVPLYYENRIPELQLVNDDLSDDLEQLLEDAELDEAQEKKVEREFAREYHLITRDDRLEKVAEDLVQHFMGRGHRGKGMMVCIDKATAVRMYDKVKAHWAVYLADLKASLEDTPESSREALAAKIKEMEEADMAVVVSQGQNEVADLAEKGLDIRPHRKRMVDEDMESKFKDANDPLRLVFVCAMWITGFDVPSCSAIYIDKPMKNHTLMQTIARANRTYEGKQAGLIVDYAGVFKNLQKALAIYGDAKADGVEGTPIKNKSELVEYLKHLIAEAVAYCVTHGADTKGIKEAGGFQRIALLDEAVEALIETDKIKKDFLHLASAVVRTYRAILPDPMANEVAPDAVLMSVLAQKIRSLTPSPDISHIMGEIADLLDASVAAEGYLMPDEGGDGEPLIDLSKIDFEKLKKKFGAGRKRTEAEKLRAALEQKILSMVSLNHSRADFLEKFQKLIDRYNAGSQNVEAFFAELIKLAGDLDEEDRRAMREGLSEEELALFDILTKPEPELSEKERKQVKKVAKQLLEVLKAEKLVIDWRNRQQSRASVRQAIEVLFDEQLPDVYDENIYGKKCDLAYRHVYDCYVSGSEGVYA